MPENRVELELNGAHWHLVYADDVKLLNITELP
jgi:hypothetical protein